MEGRIETRDAMRIHWDAPIEMDDGLVLRADVFGPVEDGAFPVIMAHGPYGKGLNFEEGRPQQWRAMVRDHPDVAAGSSNKYASWEYPDPEKWVPYGYVCVRVDSRGAGRSPGYIDHFSSRETNDLYGCIEWAGTQPWSNGKVGLTGISYYAMNQWQVAALRPPHLAAICPWEGASDWYRDATRHGGILSTFFATWYETRVVKVQYGLGEYGQRNVVTGEPAFGAETLTEGEMARNRSDLVAAMRDHTLIDDWHRERIPDLSQIEVPVLSAGNWGGHGLHLRGNTEGFLGAGSRQKWLELHGLEHWTHYYTDYGRELQRRFFDYFLAAKDNGWDEQPPVILNIRHVDGTFTRRYEDAWPIPRTDWTTLYLDTATNTLRSEPADQAEARYHPLRDDGVTFSVTLDEVTEITGPSAAKLFVRSETEDADIFLILRVFDPHGDEVTFQGANDPHTPIAHGWLRASHRKLDPERSLPYRPFHAHDEYQPLEPGALYELDVEIWPTCLVIPAGYTLALTVRGSDYEHASAPESFDWYTMTGVGECKHNNAHDRPEGVFGGEVTLVSGGDHPSTLLLPVVPAA